MSQLQLIRERRFGPLFWTQFLGALNDNLFKTAFVFLITFGALSSAHDGWLWNAVSERPSYPSRSFCSPLSPASSRTSSKRPNSCG